MASDRNYTVYIHRNKINGKVYIGITLQKLSHRWGKDGNGYKYQRLFGRAIQKYGWNNFEHKIIACNLSKDEACDLEISLITQYDATNPNKGYNVSLGGDASSYGYRHTEETKRKIGKASKQHPPSKECLKKAMESIRKPIQKYSKDGVFLCEYGSITEAAKASGSDGSAITQVCRGKLKTSMGYVYRYSGDSFDKFDTIQRCNEKRKKKVIQLSLDGEVIAEYESANEAHRQSGISQGTLSMCCRGERKTAGGYVWKYAEVV